MNLAALAKLFLYFTAKEWTKTKIRGEEFLKTIAKMEKNLAARR